MDRVTERWRKLAIEVFHFLLVGGTAYIVDVGLNNFLLYGFFGAGGWMDGSPLKAKIISTVASVIVAWLGNKLLTYGDRTTGSTTREVVLFIVVNAIGMVLTLLPAAFTWYVLGLTDPISYNISANVVGVGLAMVFRFFAYRHWVFKEVEDVPEREVISLDEGTTAAGEVR